MKKSGEGLGGMSKCLIAAVCAVSATFLLTYIALVNWREHYRPPPQASKSSLPTMVRLLDTVNRFLQVPSSSYGGGRREEEKRKGETWQRRRRRKRQCGGGGFGGGGLPWDLGAGFGGMGLFDPAYATTLLVRPPAQQQVIVVESATTEEPFTMRPFHKKKTRPTRPSTLPPTSTPRGWSFEDELEYQYEVEADANKGGGYNLSPSFLRSAPPREPRTDENGAELLPVLDPLTKIIKITNYGISIIPREGIVEVESSSKDGPSRITINGDTVDTKHLSQLKRTKGVETLKAEEIFIPFERSASADEPLDEEIRTRSTFKKNHLKDADALYFRFPSSVKEAQSLARLLRVKTQSRRRASRVEEAIRMAKEENRWRKKSMEFWRAMEQTFEEPFARKKEAGEECGSSRDCTEHAVCEYMFEGDSGMRCHCLAPHYAFHGRCVTHT